MPETNIEGNVLQRLSIYFWSMVDSEQKNTWRDSSFWHCQEGRHPRVQFCWERKEMKTSKSQPCPSAVFSVKGTSFCFKKIVSLLSHLLHLILSFVPCLYPLPFPTESLVSLRWWETGDSPGQFSHPLGVETVWLSSESLSHAHPLLLGADLLLSCPQSDSRSESMRMSEPEGIFELI